MQLAVHLPEHSDPTSYQESITESAPAPPGIWLQDLPEPTSERFRTASLPGSPPHHEVPKAEHGDDIGHLIPRNPCLSPSTVRESAQTSRRMVGVPQRCRWPPCLPLTAQDQKRSRCTRYGTTGLKTRKPHSETAFLISPARLYNKPKGMSSVRINSCKMLPKWYHSLK